MTSEMLGGRSRRSGSLSDRCWPEIEDSELVPLDDADWYADLAEWHAECEVAPRAAAARDLDRTGREGA